MAEIKIRVNQQADNLLYDLMNTLTSSIDRARSYRLQKESLAMRKDAIAFDKEQTILRNTLGTLTALNSSTILTDSGSLENAMTLLGDLAKQNVGKGDVTKIINYSKDHYARMLPDVKAAEQYERDFNKLNAEYSDMKKDDLLDSSKGENLRKIIETNRNNLGQENFTKNVMVRNATLALIEKSERIGNAHQRLSGVDINKDVTGIQYNNQLASLDISGEFYAPVRIAMDNMKSAQRAGNILEAEGWLVKANETLIYLEAEKSKATLSGTGTQVWQGGQFGPFTSGQLSEVESNNNYVNLAKTMTDNKGNLTGTKASWRSKVDDVWKAAMSSKTIDIENKSVSMATLEDALKMKQDMLRVMYKDPKWRKTDKLKDGTKRTSGTKSMETWIESIFYDSDGNILNPTIVKDDVAETLGLNGVGWKDDNRATAVDIVYSVLYDHERLQQVIAHSQNFGSAKNLNVPDNPPSVDVNNDWLNIQLTDEDIVEQIVTNPLPIK